MAKIYISSTSQDLKEERRAAARAIRSLGHQEIGMENYVASDEPPVDKCLTDVRSCDGYVGIFAWRYGYIPADKNPDGKSITRLEYEAAIEAGIPCLIFLSDENLLNTDTEVDTNIKIFREYLKTKHTVSFYNNCDVLYGKVTGGVALKIAINNKPAIPSLLPYMCNRSDQEFELTKAWQLSQKENPRRPLAAIIHGDEQECHDKYKDRLLEKTLPKILKLNDEENSIREYMVEWPRPSANLKDRCERLQANIAEKITNDMTSDIAEVAVTINQHEIPVMIYTFIPTFEWQKNEKELIDNWFKYWNDLPDLIAGRRLLVFLNIQYKHTADLGFLNKRKYDKRNADIHNIVDKHAFSKYDGLYSFTLPELSSIALGDVENWVRNHACEIGKVEKILPRVRDFFEEKNLHKIRMQQLAEELELLLDAYLSEEYS